MELAPRFLRAHSSQGLGSGGAGSGRHLVSFHAIDCESHQSLHLSESFAIFDSTGSFVACDSSRMILCHSRRLNEPTTKNVSREAGARHQVRTPRGGDTAHGSEWRGTADRDGEVGKAHLSSTQQSVQVINSRRTGILRNAEVGPSSPLLQLVRIDWTSVVAFAVASVGLHSNTQQHQQNSTSHGFF